MKRLPKTATGLTTIPASFLAPVDWQIKLSPEDEQVMMFFVFDFTRFSGRV